MATRIVVTTCVVVEWDALSAASSPLLVHSRTTSSSSQQDDITTGISCLNETDMSNNNNNNNEDAFCAQNDDDVGRTTGVVWCWTCDYAKQPPEIRNRSPSGEESNHGCAGNVLAPRFPPPPLLVVDSVAEGFFRDEMSSSPLPLPPQPLPSTVVQIQDTNDHVFCRNREQIQRQRQRQQVASSSVLLAILTVVQLLLSGVLVARAQSTTPAPPPPPGVTSVTVGSTMLAVTSSLQLNVSTTAATSAVGPLSVQNVRITKTVTLLNGAQDVDITVNITSAKVMTTVTTTSRTGAVVSSVNTATFVEEMLLGQSSPPSASSATWISAFTDPNGNSYTLFPFAHVVLSAQKLDSKVRFSFGHAQVKAYYPVSEYSFAASSSTDSSFCDGGPLSARYKCCPQGSGSSSATTLVYSLATAVQPVVCTVNASIVYSDDSCALTASFRAVERTDGSGVLAATTTTAGGGGMIVAQDVRVGLSRTWVFGNGGTLQVVRSAGTPTAVRIIADGTQLCRQSGFLANTAAPEPFLVPSWAFGFTSRQVGYNITKYVLDRQCNGAPLGYYTSQDGNNSDQFSAWRSVVASNVFGPLTWRNELVTSAHTINGLSNDYAVWFSMTTPVGPDFTFTLLFTPALASLRPTFRILHLVAADVQFLSASPSSTLTVRAQISSLVQWLSPGPSQPQLSNATVTATASCSGCSSPSLFSVSSGPPVLVTVGGAGGSSTITTTTAAPPLVVNLFLPISLALLLTQPSSALVSVVVQLTQTDINLTTTGGGGGGGMSRLVQKSVGEIVSSILSAAATVGSVALPLSVADLLTNQTLLQSVAKARIYSPSAPLQCSGDLVFNAWLGTCDPISTAACSARYRGTARQVFDTASRLCALGGTIYSLVTWQSLKSALLSSLAAFLRSSLVWKEYQLGQLVTDSNSSSSATASPAPSSSLSSSSLVWIPLWFAEPNGNSSSSLMFRHVVLNSTDSGAMDALVPTAAIHPLKMPFTAAASIALLFLLVSAGLVAVLLALWSRWYADLPYREDAHRVGEWMHEHVWMKLPTREALKEKIQGMATTLWQTIRGAASAVSAKCQSWRRSRRERKRERDALKRNSDSVEEDDKPSGLSWIVATLRNALFTGRAPTAHRERKAHGGTSRSRNKQRRHREQRQGPLSEAMSQRHSRDEDDLVDSATYRVSVDTAVFGSSGLGQGSDNSDDGDVTPPPRLLTFTGSTGPQTPLHEPFSAPRLPPLQARVDSKQKKHRSSSSSSSVGTDKPRSGTYRKSDAQTTSQPPPRLQWTSAQREGCSADEVAPLVPSAPPDDVELSASHHHRHRQRSSIRRKRHSGGGGGGGPHEPTTEQGPQDRSSSKQREAQPEGALTSSSSIATLQTSPHRLGGRGVSPEPSSVRKNKSAADSPLRSLRAAENFSSTPPSASAAAPACETLSTHKPRRKHSSSLHQLQQGEENDNLPSLASSRVTTSKSSSKRTTATATAPAVVNSRRAHEADSTTHPPSPPRREEEPVNVRLPPPAPRTSAKSSRTHPSRTVG